MHELALSRNMIEIIEPEGALRAIRRVEKARVEVVTVPGEARYGDCGDRGRDEPCA